MYHGRVYGQERVVQRDFALVAAIEVGGGE